ncbi:MAG: flagellar FlbD family protein [Bdellovibrionales bacterium]|nr:flagellar FlbD family protein [Bdellovibrionales bacterium]
MIRLTKFDDSEILINADWIQSVEDTPDTVITLTTGLKLIVREKANEVAAAFKEYKKEILNAPKGEKL